MDGCELCTDDDRPCWHGVRLEAWPTEELRAEVVRQRAVVAIMAENLEDAHAERRANEGRAEEAEALLRAVREAGVAVEAVPSEPRMDDPLGYWWFRVDAPEVHAEIGRQP